MTINNSQTAKKIIGNLLNEIGIDYRSLSIERGEDSNRMYYLNVSIPLISSFEYDMLMGSLREIYNNIKESNITKEYRDKILELEAENKKLKEDLSFSKQITIGIEEEEEIKGNI